MNDIIFWRWLDDTTLAILSYDALYTCSITQQQISHPAYTALSNRSHYLSMQKAFDCHQHLSSVCQVTDIQRDISGNLFAISSLYSTSSLLKLNTPQPPTTGQRSNFSHILGGGGGSGNNAAAPNSSGSTATLRPSFGSVPSRLSQLANNDQSFDSLKSEYLFDTQTNQRNPAQASQMSTLGDEICGLIQVHCKLRDRSQLIQAHAITFTYPIQQQNHQSQQPRKRPSILVAANKIGSQMRVHFVEMATADNYPASGQNGSTTSRFDRFSEFD